MVWELESEQESDLQVWKIAGPGSGFKNFGTGAESEKVIAATSALLEMYVELLKVLNPKWMFIRKSFRKADTALDLGFWIRLTV